MLKPLEPRIRNVQFSSSLTDPELEKVGRLMARYPDVGIRMYGHHSRSDLEWLRFFPKHRNVMIDAYNLETFDGLRHLPDGLTSLTLGQTKKRLSLAGLARFGDLKTLVLERNTKDIDVLSELTMIEDLTLRSIALPDLAVLLPMERLRSLDLKLGGTKDLGLLPEIGSLQYLEIWMVRGFDDLAPVSELRNLRYLFLQALKNVISLPDFSRTARLRRVHLETMKGLSDLAPLAGAPALEQLNLIDMGHLRLEHLEPLKGHPTLASARFGLGSSKRNSAAKAAFELPPTEPPDLDDLFD